MKQKLKLFRINSESGQSMVELAVSIVVLLILLAGMVDFGRIAFYYIAMRDAAQEGASFGSLFPNNTNEIIERAKAGVVDDNRIEVIMEITRGPVIIYSCSSKDTVCSQKLDTKEDVKVLVGDNVVITIIDPEFKITMPLIGAFIGQEIKLETTIQDVVVRVPQFTPTPDD